MTSVGDNLYTVNYGQFHRPEIVPGPDIPRMIDLEGVASVGTELTSAPTAAKLPWLSVPVTSIVRVAPTLPVLAARGRPA